MKKSTVIGLAVGLLGGILGILVLTLLLVPRNYAAPEKAGEFGDMFGVANALFSGVALIGAVFAVVLQTLELKNQIGEMEKTTKELANQTSLLRSQLRFDAWLKAQEIFTDINFVEARRALFARLKDSKAPCTDDQIALVCRKMDELARLIPALDEARALQTWDDPFAKAWFLLRDLVEAERKTTGWQQKWDEFQKFGEKAQQKLKDESRAFDGSKASIEEP